MRRTIYLLSCTALLLSLLTSCNKVNNTSSVEGKGWKDENLKGQVKSYTEHKYSATEKFGETEKENLESATQLLFNEVGDQIEFISYKSDGSVGDKIKKNYDDHGNLTTDWLYDSDGKLKLKVIYKYDDTGSLIESYWYKPEGKLEEKIKFQYEENERIKEEYSYNSEGELVYKWIRRYDENGNLTEVSSYNSEGKLENKRIRRYDENGNLTEESSYNSEGKLENKWIKQYDEKGSLIEECMYDSEGKLEYKSKFEYQYDERGNWTQCLSVTTYHTSIGSFDAIELAEREYEYYE